MEDRQSFKASAQTRILGRRAIPGPQKPYVRHLGNKIARRKLALPAAITREAVALAKTTEIGQFEREMRARGERLKKNGGEIQFIDFMSAEDGLRRYLKTRRAGADPF